MGVTTNLAPIAPGAAQDQAIRQVTDELQTRASWSPTWTSWLIGRAPVRSGR